jgi:hypothetical protein
MARTRDYREHLNKVLKDDEEALRPLMGDEPLLHVAPDPERKSGLTADSGYPLKKRRPEPVGPDPGLSRK